MHEIRIHMREQNRIFIQTTYDLSLILYMNFHKTILNIFISPDSIVIKKWTPNLKVKKT